MIQLTAAGKRYGHKLLFQGLDWLVTPQARVGLVGSNGTGKSTLLKVLGGLESLDYGTVVRAKGTNTGYLPQDGLSFSGRTVLAECMSVFDDVRAMEREMESLAHRMGELDPAGREYAEVAERYHLLEGQFRARDGYALEAQASAVLSGLGFRKEDWTRQCEEFSGGWQMRIALAKLLLQRPNLLLLDEPTNHLDLETRNWLEEYLRAYPGAYVLVSHDRYFLDVTVDKTAEIWNQRVQFYSGNYDQYLAQKEQHREQLLAAYKNQRERIEQLEAFINRFRYQATKAKQVQSRIKELEKIERIAIPPEEKTVHFTFPQPGASGRMVAEFVGVAKIYPTSQAASGDRVIGRPGDLNAEGRRGNTRSLDSRQNRALARDDNSCNDIGANSQMQIPRFARDDNSCEDISDKSQMQIPRFARDDNSFSDDNSVSHDNSSKGIEVSIEVFRNVSFVIERGERVALVGANGAGKSTLIKLLAGIEPLTSGEYRLGHNVQVDYFAQDQYKELNTEARVLDDIWSLAPTRTQTELRNLLGSFLFSEDDVFKRIGVLSGGERNRYALARMLLRPANFLLLDEPTNHLDMRAKDVLLEALEKFTGTVVFVSHDRYFIDKLATRVFEIGGGEVRVYPGNYEDYRWRKETAQRVNGSTGQVASDDRVIGRSGDRNAEEAEEAEVRGEDGNGAGRKRINPIRLRQMKERLKEVEEQVARVEAEIAECEQELSRFVSAEETQRQTELLAAKRAELEQLMGEWEELSTTIQASGDPVIG